MKTRTILKAAAWAVVFIYFFGSTFAKAEDQEKFKITYNANAIALGKGLTSNLQMTITRWTTPEERNLLLTTLVTKGQEEMIKVLQEQEQTGFLRLPNTLGYRLYYAYKFEKDGKKKIVLATDRPVSMPEAWRNTRSMDYAVTMLELNLDSEDKGEGAMLFAVKLKANQETKTLEVENYGTDPVQLKKVRKSN